MERFNLWMAQLVTRTRREEGQTMAEYAVILTLITAAVIGALALLSGNITTVLNGIAGLIKMK
jgi:Flp pilus assembly pilin Flp